MCHCRPETVFSSFQAKWTTRCTFLVLPIGKISFHHCPLGLSHNRAGGLLLSSLLLLLFSHSVMSHSLWPHGLQHARLPYLSPSPRACSHSCPLSQWCHSAISSSVISSSLRGIKILCNTTDNRPEGFFFVVFFFSLIQLITVIFPWDHKWRLRERCQYSSSSWVLGQFPCVFSMGPASSHICHYNLVVECYYACPVLWFVGQTHPVHDEHFTVAW